MKPGFYRAKWLRAAPNTHERDSLLLPTDWIIVQVWENFIDEADGIEKLGVSVPGIRETQLVEDFLWGEGPLERGDL